MLRKKFITMMILFVALIALNSNSFAQNLPGDKAGRTADMLYKKLNLSDDQYNKVYTSLLTYYTNQATYMKEYGKDKKACDEACAKDWKTVNSSMSSVLNKDQMAAYSGMNERSLMYGSMMRPHKKMTAKTDTGTTDPMATKKTETTTKKTETPPKSTDKK